MNSHFCLNFNCTNAFLKYVNFFNQKEVSFVFSTKMGPNRQYWSVWSMIQLVHPKSSLISHWTNFTGENVANKDPVALLLYQSLFVCDIVQITVQLISFFMQECRLMSLSENPCQFAALLSAFFIIITSFLNTKKQVE